MTTAPTTAPGDGAFDALLDRLLDSYAAEPRTQHLDAIFLPSRARAIEIIETLRRVVFPGFFDEQRITSANVRYHAGDLLVRLHELLHDQVNQALCYQAIRDANGDPDAGRSTGCEKRADEVTRAFLEGLPELRRLLALDVQAAFDGDPAATNTDEAVFCYPGIDAVFVHRIAHALHRLEVPMLPRIMSEVAHNETGIDIHPGATIGESFFIDHGTGVVVGETTEIGDRVQVYQGVTLGALAPAQGERWRGRKRHPTIEDDVIIYPNATILGGETVIGARSVINGSVFVTKSVPADHTVGIEHPQIKLRPHKAKRN